MPLVFSRYDALFGFDLVGRGCKQADIIVCKRKRRINA